MSVGLTKSIFGFVLKAWKSSSFIDTNMLASMPREVPMPYKIGSCRFTKWHLWHNIVAVSRIPFYQVEEVSSSQPEKPRLTLQPQATGLKESTKRVKMSKYMSISATILFFIFSKKWSYLAFAKSFHVLEHLQLAQEPCHFQSGTTSNLYIRNKFDFYLTCSLQFNPSLIAIKMTLHGPYLWPRNCL